MKLDFDIENIRSNKLELLDCEIDLIMRSLELYSYIYRFAYPRKKGRYEDKEEELRISLILNTYENILSQYNNCKTEFKNRKIDDIFKDLEKRIA